VETVSLTLEAGGYAIPAALTLPEGAPTGSVLLIPGSLFINVDGDFPSWNVYPRVYAWLAEQLSERGLAVLRFAKIGPGTGSELVDAEGAKQITNWRRRMVIANAALDRLRAELAARDLPTGKVVLAGHSEGSVVASVIAVEGAEVDGVVLLSGPSVGILSIMREQHIAMTPPEAGAEGLAVLDAVIDHIVRQAPIPAELAARAKGPTGAGALVGFDESSRNYMRDVELTDPVATIARYEGPVLLVSAGLDTSVPPLHLAALAAGRAGKPTATAHFPELQHMYKPVPPGTPPMAAFGLTGPTDNRVAEAVDHWVRTL
jgi:alpha-beta hydrolase superfamily lysophospholipase